MTDAVARRSLRLLGPLLLAGWALGAPASGQGHDQAMRNLEQGRFAEAWAALESEPDELLRARGRSAVYYAAGDPAGALTEARAGLGVAGEDLELLHRATSCALWLADPDGAADWAEALAQAVAGADLSPEHRPGWEAAVRSFESRVAELEEAGRTTRAAVRRARWSALGMLAALLAALLSLAVWR